MRDGGVAERGEDIKAVEAEVGMPFSPTSSFYRLSYLQLTGQKVDAELVKVVSHEVLLTVGRAKAKAMGNLAERI